MSIAKSRAAARQARDILENAMRRRQPASVATGAKVLQLIQLAIEEMVMAKRTDQYIVLEDLLPATGIMYEFAAAKTKKKRSLAQWKAWRSLSMSLEGPW